MTAIEARPPAAGIIVGFVVGALIMAYNIYMTIRSGEAAEAVEAGKPALAPAE